MPIAGLVLAFWILPITSFCVQGTINHSMGYCHGPQLQSCDNPDTAFFAKTASQDSLRRAWSRQK